NPQLVLLIRTQIQDGGEGAGIIRPEHIGFEARTVPHRDVDVFFDDDAVDRHAGSRLHLHCCSLPAARPLLPPLNPAARPSPHRWPSSSTPPRRCSMLALLRSTRWEEA